MRIAFATGIYPPDIGGPATYVSALARTLAAQGDTVQVVTYADAVAADEPFPVHRIPRTPSLPRRYAGFFAAVRRVSRSSDLVYLQDPLSSGLPGLLASRSAGRPVVVKIVGDLAWEIASEQGATREDVLGFQLKSHGLTIELARRAQRFVTRRAQRVIVPCRFLKGLVSAWGVSTQRISVIHNSLPEVAVPSSSREEARRELGFDEEVILVSAGRMVPWKGFDRLIRSMAPLVAQCPLVRLRIVGTGPCEEKLKRQVVELGLTETVRFTGPLDHDAMILQLRAADALVLLSSYEGFSHLILEAMREALPVVAGDVGGNRELVEDGTTGLLVPLEDETRIQTSLLRICRDPDFRERLGRAGRQRAGGFTWENMLQETMGVLQSCLGEPRRSRATRNSSP